MARDTRNGLPRELFFDDDEKASRVGDELNDNEAGELSPERTQTAGLTGGDVPSQTVDNEGTADDMTPENLLHEDGNQGSLDIDEEAADSSLSDVPESSIGGGTGLDEAELARESGAHDGKSADEK